MGRYDILMVDDDEMPDGQDWLLIEHTDGLLCVLRRSRSHDLTVLGDAWAASRLYAPQRGRGPLQATA